MPSCRAAEARASETGNGQATKGSLSPADNEHTAEKILTCSWHGKVLPDTQPMHRRGPGQRPCTMADTPHTSWGTQAGDNINSRAAAQQPGSCCKCTLQLQWCGWQALPSPSRLLCCRVCRTADLAPPSKAGTHRGGCRRWCPTRGCATVAGVRRLPLAAPLNQRLSLHWRRAASRACPQAAAPCQLTAQAADWSRPAPHCPSVHR